MVVAEGLRKSGLKCEGVNMFLADGEAAFQEVFHVHLRVIPRFRGDGFGLECGPSYGIKPERKEMDTIDNQIMILEDKEPERRSKGLSGRFRTRDQMIFTLPAVSPYNDPLSIAVIHKRLVSKAQSYFGVI
jgi:hypothetical protein